MNKVYVIINLKGGNDGLNTLIPLDIYGQYKSFRPQLAIPEASVIRLTDFLGLHPALSPLANLFKEGKLGIVRNVGMASPDLSHFRATDIWDSGSHSSEFWQNGWLGRLTEQVFTPTLHPAAIQIGTTPSLAFVGEKSTPATMTITSDNAFYDFINGTEPIPPGYGGQMLSYVRDVQRASEAYSTEIKKAAAKVTRQYTYPDSDLASQLKIVARLIAGGMTTPTYMVTLNGFDTHKEQINLSDPTTGVHAALLTELGQAITAFLRDLEQLGVADRVIGMTYSEFGRTAKQNGTRGTDHGGSAPMFYFGTSLNTNKIYGKTPQLTDDLHYEFDFRQVFASMVTWLGGNPDLVFKRPFNPLDLWTNIPTLPPVIPPATGDMTIQVTQIINPGTYRLTKL